MGTSEPWSLVPFVKGPREKEDSQSGNVEEPGACSRALSVCFMLQQGGKNSLPATAATSQPWLPLIEIDTSVSASW